MKNIWLVLILLSACIACNNKKESKKNNAAQETIVTNLKQKIAQKPDSIGLHLQLVDALDSLNDYANAITEMSNLIKKDSLNYAFWYRLGQLYSSAKDTVSAIKSYNKAIKVYPAPDAVLSLANLYAETKNSTALQLTDFILSMRLGREYNAHCYFIKGVFFARTNNKQKAISFFDECINNNFNYPEAYLEKGFIFFDAGKKEEALKTFTMCVTVNNTYADGYYWVAKCNEALNNKAEAIINYQTALQLDGNMQEAKDALQRLK